MHYLCADPVLLSLLNAPPVDEPYSEGQRERDAEAEASIARGEGISHDEVLREFGLRLKLDFVWAPGARAELSRIERGTAMRILLTLTRYAETGRRLC